MALQPPAVESIYGKAKSAFTIHAPWPLRTPGHPTFRKSLLAKSRCAESRIETLGTATPWIGDQTGQTLQRQTASPGIWNRAVDCCRLPGRAAQVKAEAGVSELVSRWNGAELSRYSGAAQIDVTRALVERIISDERQRKAAMEIVNRNRQVEHTAGLRSLPGRVQGRKSKTISGLPSFQLPRCVRPVACGSRRSPAGVNFFNASRRVTRRASAASTLISGSHADALPRLVFEIGLIARPPGTNIAK